MSLLAEGSNRLCTLSASLDQNSNILALQKVMDLEGKGIQVSARHSP